jgi:hypothetical protein
MIESGQEARAGNAALLDVNEKTLHGRVQSSETFTVRSLKAAVIA